MTIQAKIDSVIRDIPDFPKKGIIFKDITPILKNPKLSKEIVTAICEQFKDIKIDAIIGVESRGFLYGMPIAHALDIPFITVRKAGKLPYKTIQYSYDLEYGSSKMEMHIDAIQPGWNVMIHDDLLATGGTAAACAELVKMQKGNVAGFSFLIALNFLNGEERLKKYTDNIVKLAEY
jgi:adenine phosphoribosyltransferase